MENNNFQESGIPKRRALGRGLEELFNNEVLDYSAVEKKIVNETPKEEIVNVKLDELRCKFNFTAPQSFAYGEKYKKLLDYIEEVGISKLY